MQTHAVIASGICHKLYSQSFSSNKLKTILCNSHYDNALLTAEVTLPTRCSSSTLNVDLSDGKSTHRGFMTGIPVCSEL